MHRKSLESEGYSLLASHGSRWSSQRPFPFGRDSSRADDGEKRKEEEVEEVSLMITAVTGVVPGKGCKHGTSADIERPDPDSTIYNEDIVRSSMEMVYPSSNWTDVAGRKKRRGDEEKSAVERTRRCGGQ